MTEQRDPHPADAVVGDRGKPDDAGPAGHEAGDAHVAGASRVAEGGHGVRDPHAGAVDHGDGDGHGGEALGPIDVTAWGAAVLGVVLGLVVLVALLQAVS